MPKTKPAPPLRLEWLDPADLQANRLNFRTHPPSQTRALAAVMKEVGWAGALLWNERTARLIDGHARKDLFSGKGKVPVLVGSWTEDQEKMILATFDPLGSMAGADPNKLGELLNAIDAKGALKDLLADIAAKNRVKLGGALLTDPDDAPPLPKAAASVMGDLWILGEHRLLVGDATKAEDVLRLMGGERADLFITDPPYNVGYVGKTGDALTIENDQMEDREFRAFLAAAFSNADAVLRPGGVFYVWHADSEGYNFRAACIDAGWRVRQCLVWAKDTMVMGRQDYQWKHEPCLYGWKEGAAHQWLSDRRQTTLLEFDRPSRSTEHPTMKPVALFEYQIRNSTASGERVLDPFAGSGTTLIAAERCGVRAFLMEVDAGYSDVVLMRYSAATGRQPVLESTGQTFEAVKAERLPLADPAPAATAG